MTDDYREPLTADERALLADPQRAPSFVTVPVRGRMIEGVTFANLNWHKAQFCESTFRDVRFVACAFEESFFRAARFENVQFERCTFSGCRFEQVAGDELQFADCRVEDTFWKEVELAALRLERSELTGAWLEDARVALYMHGGVLRQTRMTRCQMGVLQLTEVAVAALRASYCKVARFVLQHCTVERLHAVALECGTFECYGGTLHDVKLMELTTARLCFDGLQEVLSLYLNSSDISELALSDCTQVDDLYVFKSNLKTLHIRGGRIAGWFTQSALGPGSTVADVVLADFFWDASLCDGLTLNTVRLENGLCARDAQFRGLRLIDVSYTPDFELVLDGATFEYSDRFEGPTP